MFKDMNDSLDTILGAARGIEVFVILLFIISIILLVIAIIILVKVSSNKKENDFESDILSTSTREPVMRKATISKGKISSKGNEKYLAKSRFGRRKVLNTQN